MKVVSSKKVIFFQGKVNFIIQLKKPNSLYEEGALYFQNTNVISEAARSWWCPHIDYKKTVLFTE